MTSCKYEYCFDRNKIWIVVYINLLMINFLNIPVNPINGWPLSHNSCCTFLLDMFYFMHTTNVCICVLVSVQGNIEIFGEHLIDHISQMAQNNISVRWNKVVKRTRIVVLEIRNDGINRILIFRQSFLCLIL